MSSDVFEIEPHLFMKNQKEGKGMDLVSSPGFSYIFKSLLQPVNSKKFLCTITEISPTQMHFEFNQGHSLKEIQITLHLIFVLVNEFDFNPLDAWRAGIDQTIVKMKISDQIKDDKLIVDVVQKVFKILIDSFHSYIYIQNLEHISENRKKLQRAEDVLKGFRQSAPKNRFGVFLFRYKKFLQGLDQFQIQIHNARNEFEKNVQRYEENSQEFKDFIALDSISGTVFEKVELMIEYQRKMYTELFNFFRESCQPAHSATQAFIRKYDSDFDL